MVDKEVLEWRPRGDKRSRGIPLTQSMDDLRRIKTKLIADAQNRESCKCLKEAYVQNWTESFMMIYEILFFGNTM